MKKMRILQMISVILLLCSILFVTGCDELDIDENADGTTALTTGSDLEGEDGEDSGEPVGSYDITFSLDENDKWSLISGINITHDAKNLTIEIPQTSPQGDTIVEIREDAFKGYSNVPLVIMDESFKTNILEPLEKNLENRFYFMKFQAFYQFISLKDATTEDQKNSLLKIYPILEKTDIWVLDPYTSVEELAFLSDILYTYADYTFADYNVDLAKEGSLNDGKVSAIPARFTNTDAIKAIVLPETVEIIGTRAFAGLNSLECVTMHKNVKKIGEYAFADCPSLTTIVYSGTMAEWEAIEKNSKNWIGSSWTDSVKEVTVKCSDGDVTYS